MLGVEPGAEEQTLRDAHRRRIRAAHPDAGGTDRAAAVLNEALAVLRSTSPSGAPPPAEAPPTTGKPPADVDRCHFVDDGEGNLLERLAEAGHGIGEVVFVDPHIGILEIIVGEAPGVGQLAVMVGDATADGTPVSFTLEPLGVTPAPAIGEVVGALMAALRC